MLIESDVTKYIVKGDIAIICIITNITLLITNIYESEESEKGDYNQEIPAHQKVLLLLGAT